MKDIEKAIKLLTGHSVALVRGEKTYISDERGVKPLITYIAEGVDLDGFSAADTVIGKAAAMLMVKVGIREVFGVVMSSSAKAYFERHNVTFGYHTLTDSILNRTKTGICPMESAVRGIEDPQEGYKAILNKLNQIT